jgi:predicted dinucleotide-binding enzyme
MEIGVIGINDFTEACCKHWIKNGHSILFADLYSYARSYEAAEKLGPEIKLTWPEKVARQAEVIVLAVPQRNLYAAINGLGEVKHKIIVDLIEEAEDKRPHSFTSTFDEIQNLLPESKVVKITPDFPNHLYFPEPLAPETFFSYSNDYVAQRFVRWFMDGSGFKIIDLHKSGYAKQYMNTTN